MASIVKRKNKFAVVYTCEDDKGAKKQRWETFDTNAEAKKRKTEIEFQLATGTFIAPSAKTIKELLEEYVSIYGVSNWAMSTYQSNVGTINNYILPIIGDVKLDDITPRIMDKYFQSLLKVKAKPSPFHKDTDQFLTPSQIKGIHKLLRSAFNQAVKWELMLRNPVENATLPKVEKHIREIWDADTLFHAIEICDDPLLKLALNVAFAASLRMGEMLGLTWDCIEISPHSIETGNAYLYVNKEVQRVSKDAMATLNDKGVIKVFPARFSSPETRLVLKEPKTKTSTRKVFLPKTVAEMLAKRKEEIDELKGLLGEEYFDYDLVFCSANGTPIEGAVINRALDKLIKKNGLPKVVFHSIRHTSTTYKLKLSGGDIKAVQGDTGHGTAQMVTEQYAHIIDEDRRANAVRFQEAFYSVPSSQPAAPKSKPLAIPEGVSSDDQELVMKLLTNPKALELLKGIASVI